MGFPQKQAVQVCCDSKAATSTVKNPGNHNSTKHVEIRYLFTRDSVEEGRLNIQYYRTTEMAADILTKPLPTSQFQKLIKKISDCDLEELQPKCP
jgi:hypothetical protein